MRTTSITNLMIALALFLMTACGVQTESQVNAAVDYEKAKKIEDFLKANRADDKLIERFKKTWKAAVKSCYMKEKDVPFAEGRVLEESLILVKWQKETDKTRCSFEIDYDVLGDKENKDLKCVCELK